MQLPTSQAYRLSQQIELSKAAIARMQAQIAYTRLALRFGFITTWLLYFIFVMGFYVADLWGLTTWLETNTSEYIAFMIFLAMAFLMATTLSMIKHVFYEHRAEFRYGLAFVLLIASLGVFFELFTASSQQQNIAFHNAEKSETFKATANTSINLGTSSDQSSRLAYLEGELATAQSYLQGCKKTCTYYNAKVANLNSQIQSLRTSQASSQAAAAQVASSTFKAKTEALQTIREDYYKPVFKFVRDNLTVTISTAVVLIATLIAAGFEFSHALLSRILGEKLAALAGLQNQLINQEANHLDVTHDEPLPNSNPPSTRNPIGFGIPQVTTATLAQPVRFKYQTEPEIYQQPPTEASKKQPFIGFVNPDSPPAAPAAHPVHRVKTGSVTSKLGSHEQQLSIPHFGSFKSGRDTFASPALSPEEPSFPPCAQGTQGMQGSNPVHRVEATLYEQWLQAIYRQEIKPSVTDSRRWLQQQVAGVGSQAQRKTATPVDINLIVNGYFSRAIATATRIRLNPYYRNGLPKYLLLEA
jgi:hypothetical protein